MGRDSVDMTSTCYVLARKIAPCLDEARRLGDPESLCIAELKLQYIEQMLSMADVPPDALSLLFDVANRWIERPNADNGWMHTIREGMQMRLGTFGNWQANEGDVDQWAA